MDMTEVRQQIKYNIEISEGELDLFTKVFGLCKFSDYTESEYNQIELIYNRLCPERCPF